MSGDKEEGYATASDDCKIVSVDTGQTATRYIEKNGADNHPSISTLSIAPVSDAATNSISSENKLNIDVNCTICGLRFTSEEQCAVHMDTSHNASVLGK